MYAINTLLTEGTKSLWMTWCLHFAQRGKHCEKPLTCDVRNTKDIFELEEGVSIKAYRQSQELWFGNAEKQTFNAALPHVQHR